MKKDERLPLDVASRTPGSPAEAQAEEKARLVREMFAGIAARYDLLNDILSFRRHHAWRRAAVRLTGLSAGDRALDVCTGTGDLALALAGRLGPRGRVIGSDFCRPMLELGRAKVRGCRAAPIDLLVADALRLPFGTGVFDAVTVAFGIRNVADVPRAMAEMARVARQGGRVVVLEFTQPERGPIAAVIRWYQEVVLPAIGAALSRAEAYRYLPRSIRGFHNARELAGIMEAVGLADIQVHYLNLGSVCIHVGTKR